jgi:putative salt-induced outer membrane protein YdiY
MFTKTLLRVVSVVCCATVLHGPAEAAKTDVVRLINGDAVTGEIKSLDFGSLRYSTDSMGTVTIDWEDVVNLTSNQSLQVELVTGQRFFGSLVAEAGERELSIQTTAGVVTFDTRDIIRMTPIESDEDFIGRLDGSASLGFQAQSSNVSNSSAVSADVRYRTREYLVGLRINSTVTNQQNEDTLRRQSAKLNYQRFFPDRWFSDWFGGWERNDQLGLLSRTSLGAAWGRYLVQNNSHQFSLTAGAQASRETYIGSEPSDVLGEARFEARYLYRNLAPETSLSFTTQYYPTIRDLGDYRAQSDLTLRWEMYEDIFWDLTVGYSYESDPPPDAEKRDSAITTSIGYSF